MSESRYGVTIRRHDTASHCDDTVKRHGRTNGRTDGLTKTDRDGPPEKFSVRNGRARTADFDFQLAAVPE